MESAARQQSQPSIPFVPPPPPTAPPPPPLGEVVRGWWGPITGVAGIIAMIAVGNSTLSTLAQTQATLISEQRDLARRLDEHTRSPWHQSTDQRFGTIERRMTDIETDQKNISREVRVQLEAINKNIVALCAATRGALCSR